MDVAPLALLRLVGLAQAPALVPAPPFAAQVKPTPLKLVTMDQMMELDVRLDALGQQLGILVLELHLELSPVLFNVETG